MVPVSTWLQRGIKRGALEIYVRQLALQQCVLGVLACFELPTVRCSQYDTISRHYGTDFGRHFAFFADAFRSKLEGEFH